MLTGQAAAACPEGCWSVWPVWCSTSQSLALPASPQSPLRKVARYPSLHAQQGQQNVVQAVYDSIRESVSLC